MPFLVVTGPTASGKTSFSDLLAQRMAIEVINCDVGQLYTPLSIGTAKPNLSTVPVPHHLFDLLSTPQSFSAAAYRAQAAICMKAIAGRGALPVFVGGSLFYIKSLFYPPCVTGLAPDISKSDIEVEYDAVETEVLWERLHHIDPARAEAINRNDRYRIVRALTIWQQTGQLPSSCKPAFSPIGNNGCVIAVTCAREILNERINQRVIDMMNTGLCKEVAALDAAWRDFLCKKKLIGYYELISKMNGDAIDIEKIIEIIQQDTRAYAKRQMTFLRAFLTTIRSQTAISVVDANLTLCDDYLYIEQIVAWVKAYMPQCIKFD